MSKHSGIKNLLKITILLLITMAVCFAVNQSFAEDQEEQTVVYSKPGYDTSLTLVNDDSGRDALTYMDNSTLVLGTYSFLMVDDDLRVAALDWNKWNEYSGDDCFWANDIYKYVTYRSEGGIEKIFCSLEDYNKGKVIFRWNEDRSRVAIIMTVDASYALSCVGSEDDIALQYVKLYNHPEESLNELPESKYAISWWNLDRGSSIWGMQYYTLSTTVDGKKVYLHCSPEKELYADTSNESSLRMLIPLPIKGTLIKIPHTAKYTDASYYNSTQYNSSLGYYSDLYNSYSTKKNANTLADDDQWINYEYVYGKYDSKTRTEYLGTHPSKSNFTLDQALEWFNNDEIETKNIDTDKDVYIRTTYVQDGFTVKYTSYNVPLWDDYAPDCSAYVLYAYRQYPLGITINGLSEGDDYTSITGSCLSEKLTYECLHFRSGDYVMSGNWVAFKLPNKYECGIQYTYDWSSLKITDTEGHEIEKSRIAIYKCTKNGEEYLYLDNMPAMGINISIDVTKSDAQFDAADFDLRARFYDGGLETSVVVDIDDIGKKSMTLYALPSEDQYESKYKYEYVWYSDHNGDITEILRTSNDKGTWIIPNYPEGTVLNLYCVATKSNGNAIRTKTSGPIHVTYSDYNFVLDVIDMDENIGATSDRVFIVIKKDSFDDAKYSYDQIFDSIKNLYVNGTKITTKRGSSGGTSFTLTTEGVVPNPSAWVKYETTFFYPQAYQWVIPENGTYTITAEMESGAKASKTITVNYLCKGELLDKNDCYQDDMVYFRFPENAAKRLLSFEVKFGNNDWTVVKNSAPGNTTVIGTNNIFYSGYLYDYKITSAGTYQFRFKDTNGIYVYSDQIKYESNTTHNHTLHKQDATSATCTQPGLAAYYYCEGCDKLFTDENAENETNYSKLKTSDENGHSYKTTETKHISPTCKIIEHDEITSTCAICNEKITKWYNLKDYAQHSYENTWTALGERGHAHLCQWCQTPETIEPHVYDGDADDVCNTCEYKRNIAKYDYVEEGKTLQTSVLVHTVTSEDTEWTSGWYIVDQSVTINHSVKVSGDVNLILRDGTNLKINGSESFKVDNDGVAAGIEVATGAVLKIYGQTNDSGTLTVVNDYLLGAAIGSSYGKDSGKIYIYGGTITVSSLFGGNYLGSYSNGAEITGVSEGVYVSGRLGLYRNDIEQETGHGIDDDLKNSRAVSAQDSTIGHGPLIIKSKKNYMSLNRVSTANPVYGDSCTVEYNIASHGLEGTNFQLHWYEDNSYTTEQSIAPNIQWKIESNKLILTTNKTLNAGSYYFKFAHVDSQQQEDYVSSGKLLIVEKRPITLVSASESREYDGTVLQNSTVSIKSGSFVNGEGFFGIGNGLQLYAGSSENSITYGLTLLSGSTANNYSIRCEAGTLTITPKADPITITAGSASRVYSGQSLSCSDYTFTQGVLIDGDSLSAVCGGTITDAGSVANTIASYQVLRGGIDVTNGYTFSASIPGTLTITKAEQKAPELTTQPGMVSNVRVGMEYKVTGSEDGFTRVAATALSGSSISLAAGTYDFRYSEDTNHNASPVTTITVEAVNSDPGEEPHENDPIIIDPIIIDPIINDPIINDPVEEPKKDDPSSDSSGEEKKDDEKKDTEKDVELPVSVSDKTATVNDVSTNQIDAVGEGGSLVIDLSESKQAISDISIDATSFNKIVNSEADTLEVILPGNVVLEFDKNTLKAIAAQAGGKDVKISISVGPRTESEKFMTNEQKEAVGGMNNAVIINVSILSGSANISQFNGGKVGIRINYSYSTAVRVWYLSPTGEKTRMPSYADGKTVVFSAGHFSCYVIEEVTDMPFSDVADGEYYYSSVLWAVTSDITSGVDSTHFAPNATCTRAEFVTLLWRAAGKPVVDYDVRFTDVDMNLYYGEALRWAASEGIVHGVTDTKFCPNAKINRAQAVTFLYRYAKAPAIMNMTANGPAASPFSDVSNTAYYYNAVLWASKQGITSGKAAGTFGPNDNCERAHVVVFLYNYFTK